MLRNKNNLRHLITGILLVVSTIIVARCSKDNTGIGPDGSPSDVIFPLDSVSYSVHVQPLFNQTCALVGCHSAGEGADRLKLDSYENLRFGIRGLPEVIPGNAAQSPLVLRIQGTVGDRMPLARNPLNQNQINGIRAWINEGARRN
jgi:hypothetical protein